ncbi:hypothetical protein BsWGS_23244 [Bradybaena similaris]
MTQKLKSVAMASITVAWREQCGRGMWFVKVERQVLRHGWTQDIEYTLSMCVPEAVGLTIIQESGLSCDKSNVLQETCFIMMMTAKRNTGNFYCESTSSHSQK